MGLPGSSEILSCELCAAPRSLAGACAHGVPGRALVAAGDPPPNGLIMRGVQRIERNPRLWGVESGAYSNIKADKAATIKRRIYPLCMGLSNGHGGQQLRKSRGILSVMQISSLGSFPRGRREDIAALRIQTAAKDVNGFGKAIRRQTE